LNSCEFTPTLRSTLNIPISQDTPPAFLVQAEDDYVDGVRQSLVYGAALARAHVPGGTAHLCSKYPTDAWLRGIGVISN
jgi:hypothetical protein